MQGDNASSTQLLQDLLSQTLAHIEVDAPREFHFEHPTNPEFGDVSTNVAMMLAKQLHQPPRQLAKKIVANLQSELANSQASPLTKIEVAGPGFINFTFSDKHLINQASKSIQLKIKRVQNPEKAQNRDVIVEYSSPNIAKPFTIGHLRSSIIGDAVANILAAQGWNVFRDNHLGDWGTQFGKQIYAIKKWGDESAIENSANPVKELVQLYVKFHEEAEQHPEIEDDARAWFKKLEDGDVEARRLWQKCIDWSMKEFARIYQRLDIHFTENDGKGYGESFFEDKMTPAIEALKTKGVLKDSQGAQLVFFPDDKYPPIMIMKKDGATLYATRDLATDLFRLEKYGKDIMVVNEVGAEQSLYLKQIYAIEEMLGWYKPGQRIHVKHGMYRFKEGKMSTRKGNVIWLDEVLEEAHKKVAERTAKDIPDEDIWKIAIGALKWNDLKREAMKDIAFDWDEILNLQGNSGPYLQYTFARCQAVLRKAGDKAPNLEENLQLPSELALNKEEKAVFQLLTQYDEVISRAANEFSPHYVCTYLFGLAQAFNTFYNSYPILPKEGEKSDEKVTQLRLLLTSFTAFTIQAGLQLLGIKTVERM